MKDIKLIVFVILILTIMDGTDGNSSLLSITLSIIKSILLVIALILIYRKERADVNK